MIASPLLDPFETETTLAAEPRVLAFSSKAFSLPLDDLVRLLAFDLVGSIPRPLGQLEERLPAPGGGTMTYRLWMWHLDPAVLALATEVETPDEEHRVLEFLGMGEDRRVRINMARPKAQPWPDLPRAGQEALGEGRSLGQVRVWASEPGAAAEVRRVLTRQIQQAGVESIVLARDVWEPTYRPPAGGAMTLDALPPDDQRVAEHLLVLLTQLPAEGVAGRAPRRIGAHRERVRRSSAIVSFGFETHRAATGVVHVRRREVEAGTERPGLVRTFNVAGLRGAARLRIREVGGRATAEFAGTADSVAEIRAALAKHLGGRA